MTYSATKSRTAKTLVEEATFEFTLGNNEQALEKLDQAIEQEHACVDAWHAKAEILFSMKKLDDALSAAQKAHELNPKDVLINTTLSRVWMEKGDKKQAEYYGAQARLLGWKSEINDSKEDISQK